jgi:hypothetical protein
VTLPDIGPGGYYIARPYADPVRTATTFRVSLSGTDRNPSNDVKIRTFGTLVRAVETRIPRDLLRKSDAIKKGRLIPK